MLKKTMISVFLVTALLFSGCVSGIGLGISQEEVKEWMGHYYENPQPERTPEMIMALLESQTLVSVESGVPYSIFLGEVFSQNKESIDQWVNVDLKEVTGANNTLIWRILWMSQTPEADAILSSYDSILHADYYDYMRAIKDGSPEDLLTIEIQDTIDIDMLWAKFLATGDTAYLARLIEVLPRKIENQDLYDARLMEVETAAGEELRELTEEEQHKFASYGLGQAAYALLAYNAKDHTRIHEFLEQEKTKHSPEINALLEQALNEEIKSPDEHDES